MTRSDELLVRALATAGGGVVGLCVAVFGPAVFMMVSGGAGHPSLTAFIRSGYYVVVLIALLVGGILLGDALATRFLRYYRHRNAGLCVRCRYNLTGNVSGVCPECGTAVQ